MKDTCQVYHQGRRKPLIGLFFRIYEGFLKDWRSLGDSNPCFRRESGHTRAPASTHVHQHSQSLIYAAPLMTACTRLGSIGNWRSLLPMSCATALAIAGATTGTPASPMPVGGLSVETTLISIGGTSDIRITRYSVKFDSCGTPFLRLICSISAAPSPNVISPSTCATTFFGCAAMPGSTVAHMWCT